MSTEQEGSVPEWIRAQGGALPPQTKGALAHLGFEVPGLGEPPPRQREAWLAEISGWGREAVLRLLVEVARESLAYWEWSHAAWGFQQTGPWAEFDATIFLGPAGEVLGPKEGRAVCQVQRLAQSLVVSRLDPAIEVAHQGRVLSLHEPVRVRFGETLRLGSREDRVVADLEPGPRKDVEALASWVDFPQAQAPAFVSRAIFRKARNLPGEFAARGASSCVQGALSAAPLAQPRAEAALLTPFEDAHLRALARRALGQWLCRGGLLAPDRFPPGQPCASSERASIAPGQLGQGSLVYDPRAARCELHHSYVYIAKSYSSPVREVELLASRHAEVASPRGLTFLNGALLNDRGDADLQAGLVRIAPVWGLSLYEWIWHSGVSTSQLIERIRDLLIGLADAFRAGLSLGDLCASSVLVTPEGALIATGMSCHRMEAVAAEGQTVARPTHLEAFLGLAPEELDRATNAEPSAVYSCAYLLYGALCRRPYLPRGLKTTLQMVRWIMANSGTGFPLERAPGLSPAMQALLKRGLNKDPDARQATLTEFLAELDAAIAVDGRAGG